MTTSKNKGDPQAGAPLSTPVKSAALCWAPLGEHRYCVDGDLLLIELGGGEFRMTDAEQLMQIVQAQQDRHGYYLLLVDLSRGIRLLPIVRRRIADWAASYRSTCATACIGAGTATRALMTLAIHAARLFGRGAHLMEFFSDLDSGRSWLLGKRTEFTQTAS